MDSLRSASARHGAGVGAWGCGGAGYYNLHSVYGKYIHSSMINSC